MDEILCSNDTKPAAIGVRITSNINATTSLVYAKKEVVLAAGGVFTPHLLMLSGVGPKDVLSDASIPLKKDLAAVGSNFQDHQVLNMVFQLSNQSVPNLDMILTYPDTEFNTTAADLYTENRTGPWTFSRGNAALFLPFKYFSKKYQNITTLISKQNATYYLPERYLNNVALLKGYLKQREILISHYLSEDAAVGEWPIQPWGRSGAAIQKPLSRGILMLNSTNPAGNPIVVRHAFQNPVDKMVLGEVVRWNRQHWQSPHLARYAPNETVPGPQYTSDEEIFYGGIKTASLNPACALA